VNPSGEGQRAIPEVTEAKKLCDCAGKGDFEPSSIKDKSPPGILHVGNCGKTCK